MAQTFRVSWYSPRLMLAFFCLQAAVFYADRGIIASNGINGALPQDGHPGWGIQVRWRQAVAVVDGDDIWWNLGWAVYKLGAATSLD